MKLMKHITIALVLSAIPAMAFGQVGAIDAAMVDVLCPPHECHVATYFKGSGGFVGMAIEMDDDEATVDVDESDVEVAFIVSCGNVTTRMVAKKDDMGVVRQSFNETNGLACEAGGQINIHRLMPGGWYWINDAENSAVASLMPKTVLGNTQVAPLDPGGLTVSTGDNATYVKHETTGRVGILQHIQPTPPVSACGGPMNVSNRCVLHANYTITMTMPPATGDIQVPVGASVERDAADPIEVTLGLGGTGFIDTSAADVPPTATWTIGGPGGVSTPGVQENASAGTFSIAAGTDARCAATNADRDSAVMVKADAATSVGVVPGFGETGGPSRTIAVTCPALPASANQGVELVPDNPFPVSQ